VLHFNTLKHMNHVCMNAGVCSVSHLGVIGPLLLSVVIGHMELAHSYSYRWDIRCSTIQCFIIRIYVLGKVYV